MATPAVCPRLLEILTTLTFRALLLNHIEQTFETIANQETQTWRHGRLVVHMGSAIYHELTRTQTEVEREVCRCIVCCMVYTNDMARQ